ncbi:hypothetical protein F3Y22_tig00109957pilonHSYRG00272 [Hibiscus syriacus]|uniref:RNase H type-1 domain-containing protein n=1 Tax=Hibiscus syriacus TaxID=106335 RepID=A0A6A3BX15_HIBSY|nr:hypothetical protein F3Y22_tig00109957pilonHSYRG00272 [Hibiscus syriacus]
MWSSLLLVGHGPPPTRLAGVVKCPRHLPHAMDAFQVESLACLEGLLLVSSLGHERIIVEGDSRSIISRATSSLVDHSYGSSILNWIRELVASFDQCIFQHVGQSGNGVADAFAREGLSGHSADWLGRPPPSVVSLLVADGATTTS